MSISLLAAAGESRFRRLGLVLLALLMILGAAPSSASAHGPSSPVASAYLARLSSTPYGTQVKVVDGDQRLWLRAGGAHQVVVRDYRGAPYLRFTAAGVEVNQNSEMAYLNRAPAAEQPPPGLTRATPGRWSRVTTARTCGALAGIALGPWRWASTAGPRCLPGS